MYEGGVVGHDGRRWRRAGRTRDSQGGVNWEKLKNLLQYFVIFCKEMGQKEREAGGSDPLSPSPGWS